MAAKYEIYDDKNHLWTVTATKSSTSSIDEEYNVSLKATDLLAGGFIKIGLELKFILNKRYNEFTGTIKPTKLIITSNKDTAYSVGLVGVNPPGDSTPGGETNIIRYAPRSKGEIKINLEAIPTFKYDSEGHINYKFIFNFRASAYTSNNYTHTVDLNNEILEILNKDLSYYIEPDVKLIEYTYEHLTPSSVINIKYSRNNPGNSQYFTEGSLFIVINKFGKDYKYFIKNIDNYAGSYSISISDLVSKYPDLNLLDCDQQRIYVYIERKDNVDGIAKDSAFIGIFYFYPAYFFPAINISYSKLETDNGDYPIIKYPHNTCLLLTDKLEERNKLKITIFKDDSIDGYGFGCIGGWSGNDIIIKCYSSNSEEAKEYRGSLYQGVTTIKDLNFFKLDNTEEYEIIVIPYVEYKNRKYYSPNNRFNDRIACTYEKNGTIYYGFKTEKFRLLNYPRYTFSGLDSDQTKKYTDNRKFIKNENINNTFNTILNNCVISSVNADTNIHVSCLDDKSDFNDDYIYEKKPVIVVCNNDGSIYNNNGGHFMKMQYLNDQLKVLDYKKLTDILAWKHITRSNAKDYKIFLFNEIEMKSNDNKTYSYYQYIARLYYIPEVFPDSFNVSCNIAGTSANFIYNNIKENYKNHQNGILNSVEFQTEKYGTPKKKEIDDTCENDEYTSMFVGLSGNSTYYAYALLNYIERSGNNVYTYQSRPLTEYISTGIDASDTEPVVLAPRYYEDDIYSFMYVDNKIYFPLIIKFPQDISSYNDNIDNFLSNTKLRMRNVNNINEDYTISLLILKNRGVKILVVNDNIIILIDTSIMRISFTTYNNILDLNIDISYVDMQMSEPAAIKGIKYSLNYGNKINYNDYKTLYDIAKSYCLNYANDSDSASIINYENKIGGIIKLDDFDKICTCLNNTISELNGIVEEIPETIQDPIQNQDLIPKTIKNNKNNYYISNKENNSTNINNKLYNAISKLYDWMKIIFHQNN